MRTTIDLRDELHKQAQAIARDTPPARPGSGQVVTLDSGLAQLHSDVAVLVPA